MNAPDVLATLDAAFAVLDSRGARATADDVKSARAAVAELIDAAAYALRTRDEAGALSETAEHNLREALADCGGAK